MRSRLTAVAICFLLLGLAGCARDKDDAPQAGTSALDPPSEKMYDILPVAEEWVTMSDGERMHNAVYRPDTDEAVPVFINFSPYWGDTAELGGDGFSHYMIDEYVPRGYAVVLSAIRGTGHSEGCFQIGGDRELMDLNEVVDHYAGADWSNGNIAAGGKSYDSTSQNGMIAKFPHPALKGIFHVSGITDMYRYNYVGGVPYPQGPIFNTYYYLQGTDEYGASFLSTPSAENLQSEDADSLARIIDDAACTEFPQMQASGVGSGVTGLKDDYWIERDWTRYIGDSSWNGSIFFVHGLQDWNVKPDHILPWIDDLPEQVRVKGWLHQWQQDGTGHVYPMRDDWNATMLAWLDSELKGKQTGFWDGPVWDVMGTDGLWRADAAWPLGQEFTFSRDNAVPPGNLVVQAGPDNTLTLTFDPGEVGLANATGHLRMSGLPHITLTATPQSPDAILTAVLYVGGQWVGEAVLRAIYDDGLDAPTPVIPGMAATFTMEAYPLDVVIAPGQDLTVVLGGTPTQALATPAGTALVEYGEAVSFTARFSPADARADQPAPTPCFAC